ncbi:MAG: hypothetical protein HDS31_07375 [Bacteroides sp.]|nr:hypothetical protein [Bacteroides sp.]
MKNMFSRKGFSHALTATVIGGGMLALASISCTPVKRGAYTEGSATIFCDDGFRQVLQEEIEVFEYTYPNSSIIPFYVSESEAIDTLLANKTQAIITTRELTKEQKEYMKAKYKRIVRQNCIAVDAVALIVNNRNPIETLSMTDIKGILDGSISTWNQLAASPDTTKIKLVFDNQGSSTVSYMRDKFLGPDGKISDNKNAFAQNNNAQVFDYVKKDPNAIGIISVNWLGDDLSVAKKVPIEQRMEEYNVATDTIATELTTEVKILKVSNPTEENDFSPVGFKPYQVYINSGEYPLFRKVYMVSTASNSTVLHSFYVFVTGFVGQKIITKTGILPYHMNPRVVQLAGKKK